MQSLIHICPDAESLAQHVCDWLVDEITQHHAKHATPFSLALSGGSTPKRLYQLLSKLPPGAIDWQRVVLVWGDERNVPDDHQDSNYRMVEENLLDHIDIPPANVLAVPNPGQEAVSAAARYERLLREALPADTSGQPRLNCVLLGIGDDVHTASLFPATAALKETTRSVIENWVEKLDCWRITLTAPAINSAERVAFLISGDSKQKALQALWHGERDAEKYPAQLIAPTAGQLLFMVDEAALGANKPPQSSSVKRSCDS